MPIFTIANKFQAISIDGVTHSIATTGPPVAAKCRRLRPELLLAFHKQLINMLELNVLEPSNSAWSSPLHMQRKQDGSWRLRGDFCQLKAIMKKDSSPVPNVLDVAADLVKKIIFSKVDLLRGFWQIQIASKDHNKTAIITPRGLYQFCRMLFGLQNAPATFQRAMDSVLRGLRGVYFVFLPCAYTLCL